MANFPRPSFSIQDYPDLFMTTSKWSEKYPNENEQDERMRPMCVIINNLKNRGVDHATMRRAFQLSGYKVICRSDVSACTIVSTAEYAKSIADPEYKLIFYVISEGTCGVLADMFPYKVKINDILDVFNPFRLLKWKEEVLIFDSNQLLTKEFDENGEAIPSTYEKELRFTKVPNSQGRENQTMILGCKPGDILTFRTINDVKMTCFSWAFTYCMMAKRLIPGWSYSFEDYLMKSPDLNPMTLEQRRELLPTIY